MEQPTSPQSASAPVETPAGPVGAQRAIRKSEAPQRRARIVLVDDHPIVRHGLAQVIAREPDMEVCGEASNAGEAIQLISACMPDLVVVDLTLQDGDGIELIKDIKARHEPIKMLVSSMHDETLYAERALRAGAAGYINKAASREQVTGAIRQVLRGKIYLSDSVSNRLLQRVVDRNDDATQSPVEKLSDRELAVFDMIGQGLSTRQIAERLHLSVKTIETYREHIKSKLSLSKSSELVRHAVRWQLEQK
ncbi:MAG: response regulator transcription factor [Planctomycetota bacterium]|nr:response regulator transcription factor [Planctomycetota bacterium]